MSHLTEAELREMVQREFAKPMPDEPIRQDLEENGDNGE